MASASGRLIVTVLAMLITFLLGLRVMEPSMIFFPTKYPDGFWQTARFGIPVEDCFFKTPDGVKLHGWYVPYEGSSQTLLWCHGNAGNISHRLDQLKLLHERVNVNIFILSYRGYGRSEGSPSEEGLYQDARAAYDYLVFQKHVRAEQMVLYGQSLGGAVVVDLAVARPCAGLIVESSFSSAKDVAQRIFSILPVHYFIGVRFDSITKIKQVHVPVLIIHGTDDEVIPYELGRKLFDAANEPKAFYSMPGATHNDPFLVGGEAYYRTIRRFIERLPSPSE